MFSKFLKENKISALILMVLRVYLGLEFFKAGFGKLTGEKPFDATGFLHGAVANPVKGPHGEILYGWWVSFLNHFAIPNVELFNFLVPWGELLVGIGLIVGCLTTAAAFFGLFMNFAFFFSGTVSQNPLDILLGVIILTAGYNAGRYGLDRWVMPYIKEKINKFKNNKKTKLDNKPKMA